MSEVVEVTQADMDFMDEILDVGIDGMAEAIARYRVALSAQVEELREGLFELAIAAGELVVATDEQKPIRAERVAVLAQLKSVNALLAKHKETGA